MRITQALIAGVLAAGLTVAAGCSRARPGTQPDDRDIKSDTSNDTTAKAPGDPPGSKRNNTMSNWQMVKDWAGDDASVGHFEDIRIPGMEFFFVSESGPSDISGHTGVAVVAGKIVTGKDAMRAVIERKPSDATMASAALLLLGQGGELLTAATSEQHRQAGVTAPAVAGDVLTFYWENPGINVHELMRATLHLGTLEFRTEPVRAGNADEVAEAERMLASTSRSMYRLAVNTLAACTDPRAAGVLARTVQSHGDAEARGHAAEAMARCHDKSSVAALIKALDSDKDSGVRWRAATALGALGDPGAVPALTRASNDPDPNVSYAAKTALGKLK